MSGLAAKAGADASTTCPTELDRPRRPPQISYVYASDGKTLLATFYDENRRDVPLAEIAPVMQQAIIAAEDQRFYQHNGVDVKGVAAGVRGQPARRQTPAGRVHADHAVRPAGDHVLGRPPPGRGRRDRGHRRPQAARDAATRCRWTKQYTKDQILERYLNIAAFGHGAYGIYAASQVYFSKEPKDLTLAEAALLAGLLKAPTEFDPATENGYPQARGPPQLRARPAWSELGIDHRPSRPTQAKKAEAGGHRQAGRRNGCVAASKNTGASSATTSTAGGSTSRRSAPTRTTGSAGSSPAATGSSPRWTSRPGRGQAERRGADEQHRQPRRADAGRDRAGHRLGPGDGGQPQLQLDDRQAEEPALHATRRRPRRGSAGTYPNTTNPLISGGGDITATRPARRSRSSRCGRAGAGLPARLHDQRPVAVPVADYRSSPRTPAPARATTLLPGQRRRRAMAGTYNMWTGFGCSVNTYFVPLQEQVGAEKVIDDRQAARHPLPQLAGRQRSPRPKTAATVRAVHPRRHRHRAAGAGQRVRHRRRRRHVLRADAGQRDHRPQGQQARRRATRGAPR